MLSLNASTPSKRARANIIVGLFGKVALVLALAAIAQFFVNNRALDMMDQRLADVKAVAVTLSQTTSADDAVLALVKMRDVVGAEAFATDGRRAAQAGEPLEIAGYRLDRNEPLVHDVLASARREVFWPADILEGAFALAVRVDTKEMRQRSDRLITIIWGIGFAAILIIAGMGLYRKKTAP